MGNIRVPKITKTYITCVGLTVLLTVVYVNNEDGETGACSSCPCLNGAKCKDVENGFRCECLPGYNGHKCETEIDECLSSPCDNGGTCVDEVNNFKCTCSLGFMDSTCSTDIDECDSSPCQNGGSCIDSINGYSCDCPVRYDGENCQTVICVSGWRQYKSKCYFYGTESKSWNAAKASCEANNSFLVEITSKDIDEFLKKELNTGKYNNYHYFTGGTDAALFGVWKWAGSNKTFSFVDWGVNQPGYSEHCVALDKDDGFKFHDYPCNHNIGFICETDL